MSRRMKVSVWGFVLVSLLSLLSDPAEAGGRRRRARYCPPTCCQPQPVCCPPSCAPAPSGTVYLCAAYYFASFGGVCYWYAPQCSNPDGTPTTQNPIMIVAACSPTQPLCTTHPPQYCVAVNSLLPVPTSVATGVNRGRAHVAAAQSRSLLDDPMRKDYRKLTGGQFGEVAPIDEKMYWLKFVVTDPGPYKNKTIIAKVALYAVSSPVGPPNPQHFAIGLQVDGEPTDCDEVLGIVGTPVKVGNHSQAYFVDATIPDPDDSSNNVTVTFLVSVSKRQPQ
jgi:hypothetical protein